MAQEEAFDAAVLHVQNSPSLSASNEEKLLFYSFYKQAVTGDCTQAEPSRFSVVAHAKWKAWSKLRGMGAEAAKHEYIATVQRVDPAFRAPEAAPEATPARSAHASGAPRPVAEASAPEVGDASSLAVAAATGSAGARSRFGLTVLLSLCLSGAGLVGFLLTTLSTQALLCLALVGLGLLGVVGAIAQVIDEHGLIALYPRIMQNIYLERTMVEVILDGTIVQKIKDAFTEVYPVLFCKTPEDRVLALQNMSEETRRWMTTRGVVNLLPQWQQRLLLSRSEQMRQRVRLANEATAYLPAIDAAPGGLKQRSPQLPSLDKQSQLAARLWRQNMQDRVAEQLLAAVNPQFCKGASLALALSLAVQLRLSQGSRDAVKAFVRSWMLSGSSVGAILFALLAAAHQLAKRYLSKRAPLLAKPDVAHETKQAKRL